VVAVYTESSEQTLRCWAALLEQGIYVNLVLPPAAPDGKTLLRCSVSAAHTCEQIDRLLQAFSALPQTTIRTASL
jgi:8-amino-7-oxononanoate synthase